jgi:hypothetical protein
MEERAMQEKKIIVLDKGVSLAEVASQGKCCKGTAQAASR